MTNTRKPPKEVAIPLHTQDRDLDGSDDLPFPFRRYTMNLEAKTSRTIQIAMHPRDHIHEGRGDSPMKRYGGFGCNHLNSWELASMEHRGYDPGALIKIQDEAMSERDILTFCAARMPRYWTDDGAVLVHPREVHEWLVQNREEFL